VRASGEPIATIKDDDSVICFNFRPDRARQITRALAVPDFIEFPVSDRPRVEYVCFTNLRRHLSSAGRISTPPSSKRAGRSFGSVCTRNFRLAETEKYAHVTYFFNGGVEQPFACEQRLLVPSPKVATYDLQPEMSAFAVTEKVLRGLTKAQQMSS
jgi:2,3-bisphosphoglycerate-independent phosphoglycerate mutase